MTARSIRLVLAATLAAGSVGMVAAPGSAETPCAGFCAGAASVDMTWHTGAGQGQYGGTGNGLTSGRFDPFHHQTKMVPSHGVQSRAYTKAIVVKGSDGTKVAYAKVELYLVQDVLTRRIAQLVSGGDPLLTEYHVPGLDGSRIMLGTTHNHSAPYYTSTAWGPWLFTDVFDFRMYEITARRIAKAIHDADAAMVPAVVGAAVTRYDEIQQNILGPATADDGTPAGFPRDHFDEDLTVIRFDAADGSGPIAAWVNLGMHPESLATSDFMSADFTGVVERMIERGMGRRHDDRGPIVAWGQGAVGDVEPDRDARAHPPAQKREYWHRDFAQAELMSRDLSAAVLDTWSDIARGTPEDPARFVPLTSDPEVGMVSHRFSGPVSHPVPTVSNCRTERPGVPIVGLPDCSRQGGAPPQEYGTTLRTLKAAGIPVPDDYGAPAYIAVQEALTINLQVIRIGDIVVGSCPCEPISDMVLNFKSRTDADAGSIFDGFDWPCRNGGATGVECNFATAAWRAPDWRPVNPGAHARMVAQIHNDAAGWEDDYTSLQGESEPLDPAGIKGNFTKEEIQDLRCGEDACGGYAVSVMTGQANDYVGYIVTYREHMRGDHYRKALTAFGPHTADYVNTRLVRMAASLRGGEPAGDATLDPVLGPPDELMQVAKAMGTGAASTAGLAGYEAAIPDDGGSPGLVVRQPAPLERFGAARVTWEGGSNWTDDPLVTVERLTPDGWATVATQDGGEIVVSLKYESAASNAPLDWLTGGKRYEWTATWEVFETTEPGRYRFTVSGHHRSGRAPRPYAFTSTAFEVRPWTGIQVSDLEVDPDAGTARFRIRGVEATIPEAELETDEDGVIGPGEIHYPDTYAPTTPYISASRASIGNHRYCWRCTFRPWANTGSIRTASVSVNGTAVEAALEGNRWVASGLSLSDGDTVSVEPGAVLDAFGNTNLAGLSITIGEAEPLAVAPPVAAAAIAPVPVASATGIPFYVLPAVLAIAAGTIAAVRRVGRD